MSFNPYLFFSDGGCKAAFTRYQEVLGGELQVMTMADMPAGEEGMDGADPNTVLHASLRLGDTVLMGSDDPTGDGGPKLGFAVTFTAPDAASAERVFEQLSKGGEVGQPLIPTFFSPAFGMLTDHWGIPWMVTAQS